MRLTFGLAALLITTSSGCDFKPDKLFDVLLDRTSTLSVLSSTALQLGESPTKLIPAEPLKVSGEQNSVCLVLQADLPLQDSKVMNRAFDAAMRNSRVRIDLLLSTGERITLAQPLQAWRKYGVIFPKDELAACSSVGRTNLVPMESKITGIEISAVPTLEVRGAYWWSEKSAAEINPLPTNSKSI